MPLTRRGFAGLLPAALVMPAWGAEMSPEPATATLAFAVWRKGSKIGNHTATLNRSGEMLSVETRAHLIVGLGPIALYRYDYHVIEHWTGGQLQALDAQTNDNGAHGTCSVRRTGGKLMVDGSKSGRYEAPANSIAGTHWNRAEIDGKIINPESGLLMSFNVADRGMDAPPDGRGTAHRYALTGFGTVDLWWDSAGTWVGLRGVAKDKSIVEYRRI